MKKSDDQPARLEVGGERFAERDDLGYAAFCGRIGFERIEYGALDKMLGVRHAAKRVHDFGVALVQIGSVLDGMIVIFEQQRNVPENVVASVLVGDVGQFAYQFLRSTHRKFDYRPERGGVVVKLARDVVQ